MESSTIIPAPIASQLQSDQTLTQTSMCLFPQVKHACSHSTLVTHPKSIVLCDQALLFVKQNIDRAPAFCTPLGLRGRDDLYNEEIVLDISEDYSRCPDCHAKQPTPVCGDPSDQSWELQCLRAIKVSLATGLKNVESDCQAIEYDQKMPAIVNSVQHSWLQGMLQLNRDGFFALGDAVIDRVHHVQRYIGVVLSRCNIGIPSHSLDVDVYAAVSQYDETWSLMYHFFQVSGLLKDIPRRNDYQNEICKQAEMIRLLLEGPQEAPQDLHYLQPGFKTPTMFKLKRDSNMEIDRVSKEPALHGNPASNNYYASALAKLLQQSDVLPLRRASYEKPLKYVNKKRGPPTAVLLTVMCDAERANIGELEV